MRTEVFEVTCSECSEQTTVAQTYWPATRHEPPDGETKPEECPKCGHFFGQDDKWEESEPPEPDHHDREEW